MYIDTHNHIYIVFNVYVVVDTLHIIITHIDVVLPIEMVLVSI